MRTAVLICVLSMLAPATEAVAKARNLKLHFEQDRVLEVVKWFSQQTGRNFIVSDGARERLTIISSSRVEESQAWEALRLALRDKELRLVDEGPFYRIVHRHRRGPREARRVVRTQEREVTLACEDKALPDLSEQARMVPATVDGKPRGIKIFGIAAGSFFERFGLHNGDVLRRLDGRELNKASQLLEVLGRVKDGDTLEIQLLRRGEAHKSTWRLRCRS